jgi:PelA/Pel-15E family pectate lyase
MRNHFVCSYKFLLCCTAFICLPVRFLLGQSNFGIENVSGFNDSKHHWLDITDHEQVIVPLKNQKDYQPTDFREIADNILLYQQPNGGWPKNYDMLAILTDDQKKQLAEHKDANHTTFDNGATYEQIEYLAKAYTLTGDNQYKDAALHGIQFILKAQYDNGGWPQFYPDLSGYRKYITFNDGAMIGVMTVLQHIVGNEPYYSFLNDATKEKIAAAYRKGIDCILKCQIKENGKLSVWCQQHDNMTLKPANARTFELASKCSEESAEIVGFLMHIDKPGKDVINAVNEAVAWFRTVQIKGIRVKTISAEPVVYQFHATDNDRVVVQDSAAPPIWTRFYELETDRPMFANRDGKAVYQLSDVARERRTGYAWYGYWPNKLINDEYAKWLERVMTNDK